MLAFPRAGTQEYRSLAHEKSLEHRRLRCCQVGTQQGLFAVTEYCPDGDYRRLLRDYSSRPVDVGNCDPRFPPDSCRSLRFAYPIVPVILKPENILVAQVN